MVRVRRRRRQPGQAGVVRRQHPREGRPHPQQRGRDHAVGPGQQGRGGDSQPLKLRLLQPLRLGPPVLEPDLDLCLGELERGRELCPLGDAQVLLGPELLLQGGELLRGEGRARLPVGLVLPQRADLDGSRRGLQRDVCND